VVTRDPDFTAEGAHVVHSVEAAMERAQAFAVALNADEITVVGGGDIFRQLMPVADRIHLTLVHAEPEGDAFFPLPDDTEWIEESRAHHEPGEGDDHAFDFVVYARRSAADMT
jgi:dihydrofolate reductase